MTPTDRAASPAETPVRRKAFLHIGLPKTGTTYLQHALWANKSRLADRGLLLPGETRRRHLLASLDVREDPKLARRAGNVAAPWQDLVEECRRWPGDVVISHEFFAAASPDQVRRAVRTLNGFDVHVIITARPMSDLGVSRWQEWVKSGGELPIDQYPAKQEYDPTDEWGWGSFDLADILDRWAQVLDPARIHVLVVDPKSGSANRVWEQFAAVLGLDHADLPVSDVPANPSLGVVEVELLRRVNPLLSDFKSAADRGNWIRGFLAEGKILPEKRERFRAGERTQVNLVERGNRATALLRDGGFDVLGDLAGLESGFSRDVRHPDEVSADEMLDSAVVAIANLLRAVRSLTEERDALRRKRRTAGNVRTALAGRARRMVGAARHTIRNRGE